MKPFHIDTSIFLQEPAEHYHAQSKEYLSSHQLIDFMRCPLLHHKKKQGLIAQQPSASYFLGQAAHVRILEGEQTYQDQFALGGPINPDTQKPYGTRTKVYAQWAQKQGKPVISFDQMALIEQMAEGVGNHQQAMELISYGIAEGVLRATYHHFACQIRLDWVNPKCGIVDVKTCDDLTWFESDARKYGYHHQMAFYQSVLCEVIGIAVPVYLIAIEKKEPFRCGVWKFSENSLALAKQDNQEAMDRLLDCQQRGVWPTGYEQMRILEIN